MTRQISEKEKMWVLKRDGNCCRYCGTTKGPFEFDHVYPHSKGGETSIKNIVTSCTSCNRRKHDFVGIWPKPIGYFNDDYPDIQSELNPMTSKLALYCLLILSIVFIIASAIENNVVYLIPVVGWGLSSILIGIKKSRELDKFESWRNSR